MLRKSLCWLLITPFIVVAIVGIGLTAISVSVILRVAELFFPQGDEWSA